MEEQFSKFMEVLKQLTVTFPFTDALTQMPSYAKFLKEVLLNKRSLKECKKVQLNLECSAVVSRELPPKLGDPGKFTIPCNIGKATIKKALCDLGASVSLMPYTVFQRIGVGELKPTRMTLQLADTSTRKPLGIVEDVPVQVGRFFVPADFVVVDMKEDKDVPIILGRPFLRTARAIFDTYEGTLTMNIGGEKVQFRIDKAMKYQDIHEDDYEVDMIDDIVHKMRDPRLDFLDSLPDETNPEQSVGAVEGGEVAAETEVCDPQPPNCGPQEVQSEPKTDKPPPLDAKKKVKMKPLPDNLTMHYEEHEDFREKYQKGHRAQLLTSANNEQNRIFEPP